MIAENPRPKSIKITISSILGATKFLAHPGLMDNARLEGSTKRAGTVARPLVLQAPSSRPHRQVLGGSDEPLLLDSESAGREMEQIPIKAL